MMGTTSGVKNTEEGKLLKDLQVGMCLLAHGKRPRSTQAKDRL